MNMDAVFLAELGRHLSLFSWADCASPWWLPSLKARTSLSSLAEDGSGLRAMC